MFDRLFGRVEREIDSLVWKYVRRAIIAVPLLVAAIFATIVCSILAVERFGPVQGYAIMAGGFVVLSGIVALFAYAGSDRSSESRPDSSDEQTAEANAKSEGPGIPPEALSLLTAIVPVALPRLARSAARNLPTLVILAIIAFVVSRYRGRTQSEPDHDGRDQPTGEDDQNEPAAAHSQDKPADAVEASASMAARAATL